MAFRSYLAEEIALDRADGRLSRREALRRLALLGLSLPAASALLAACGDDDTDDAAKTDREDSPTSPASPSTSPGSTSGTEAITFAGESGQVQGAYAAPSGAVKGAVVVVHENRGLTPHIASVAARLAGDGYAAIAPDLVSPEGGTATVGEAGATAALGAAPTARLVGDVRGAIAELGTRHASASRGIVGFCFGGGMTWSVLAATTPELAAAVPFYGPFPDGADLSGNQAAVLGVYAELDGRVNGTRDAATAALQKAGLTHEIRTFPGVDHAFFNDTGSRYNADAATTAYAAMLDWFDRYLT